jgi:SAM-dependent methyltransferase
MGEIYTKDFYDAEWLNARSSAGVIVPLLLQLIWPVRSVIDLGCGRGDWLAVFKEYGVEVICGVDGDWVPRKILQFPKEHFVPYDLTQLFTMNRKFDLVLSLEVAEHLAEECAETFVRSLTSLGSAVLFSAAVPGQGGQHHVNEQWQGYWAKLFEHKGYMAVDCVRHRVWNNPDVLWFYAQNAVLYVDLERLENEPLLKREYELRGTSQLSMAHPEMVQLTLDHAKSQRRERLESLRQRLEQERRLRQDEQAKQVRDQDRRLRELREKQRRLRKRRRLLEEQLESIQGSRAWKLVGVLRRVKAKALSLGRRSS